MFAKCLQACWAWSCHCTGRSLLCHVEPFWLSGHTLVRKTTGFGKNIIKALMLCKKKKKTTPDWAIWLKHESYWWMTDSRNQILLRWITFIQLVDKGPTYTHIWFWTLNPSVPIAQANCANWTLTIQVVYSCSVSYIKSYMLKSDQYTLKDTTAGHTAVVALDFSCMLTCAKAMSS